MSEEPVPLELPGQSRREIAVGFVLSSCAVGSRQQALGPTLLESGKASESALRDRLPQSLADPNPPRDWLAESNVLGSGRAWLRRPFQNVGGPTFCKSRVSGAIGAAQTDLLSILTFLCYLQSIASGE